MRLALLCFVIWVSATSGSDIIHKGCYSFTVARYLTLGESDYFKDFFIYGVTNHKQQCYDQCRYGENNRYVLMFSENECACLDLEGYKKLIGWTWDLPNVRVCNTKCLNWPENKFNCGGKTLRPGYQPRPVGELYELPPFDKSFYLKKQIEVPQDPKKKPSSFMGCFKNDIDKPLSLKEIPTFANTYKRHVNNSYVECYLKCQEEIAGYVMMWKGDECLCVDEKTMQTIKKEYTRVDEHYCNRMCISWPEAQQMCGGVNTAKRAKPPQLQGFGSVYKLVSGSQSGDTATDKESISLEEGNNDKLTPNEETKSKEKSEINHLGCLSFRPAGITSLGDAKSEYKQFYIYNVHDHKEQCYMQCQYGEFNVYAMMFGTDQCLCIDFRVYKQIQRDTVKVPDEQCKTKCKKWPENKSTCGMKINGLYFVTNAQAMGDLYKLPPFNKQLYLREHMKAKHDPSRIPVEYKGCYRNDKVPILSLSDVADLKDKYIYHVNDSYIDCYKRCADDLASTYVLMWKGDECICVNDILHYIITLDYTRVDDYKCNRACISWPESGNLCGGLTMKTREKDPQLNGLGSLYKVTLTHKYLAKAQTTEASKPKTLTTVALEEKEEAEKAVATHRMGSNYYTESSSPTSVTQEELEEEKNGELVARNPLPSEITTEAKESGGAPLKPIKAPKETLETGGSPSVSTKAPQEIIETGRVPPVSMKTPAVNTETGGASSVLIKTPKDTVETGGTPPGSIKTDKEAKQSGGSHERGPPVEIRHDVHQEVHGKEQRIVILDEYIIND